MKVLLFLLLVTLLGLVIYFSYNRKQPTSITTQTSVKPLKENTLLLKLKNRSSSCKAFLKQNQFSTHYIFLIDMSLPSGKARFFIYDLQKDSIIKAGLVAHGSCGTNFLSQAQFSNVPGCGCSSMGRYKIGGAYNGRFGKAFKLLGMDSTNSNAYERNVVLHAYDCVPEKEIYPAEICNSLGCAMVSYKFLDSAARLIESSPKPILLWMYH